MANMIVKKQMAKLGKILDQREEASIARTAQIKKISRKIDNGFSNKQSHNAQHRNKL